MRFDKKLLRLYISKPLYESLKRSANLSRRPFGHELALRLEYGVSRFQSNTKKLERPKKDTSESNDQEIQLYLKNDSHSRLKKMAFISNLFIMDLAALILFNSDKEIKSVANSENVILNIE